MPLKTVLCSALYGCITASVLLSGCTKDPPPQTASERTGQGGPQRNQPATPASTVTLRISLTGLLLIVPPQASTSGPTNVLVPRKGGHSALFAFGFDQANPPKQPDLCLNGAKAPPGALTARMCYVDLEVWELSALGESPASTAHVNMEQFGAVNITRGSGNTHKVNLQTAQQMLHQNVVFNRGAPKQGCSLATWKYDHVVTGQQELQLANVIPWEMTVPGNFKLVFTKKDSTVADTVPLVPNSAKTVDLILANIPQNDVKDLPPTPGGLPHGNPPLRADDFHDFYDLIGLPPSTPGTDPHRPLPHSGVANPLPGGCGVRISTKSTLPKTFLSVRTFSCMPASAELGP